MQSLGCRTVVLHPGSSCTVLGVLRWWRGVVSEGTGGMSKQAEGFLPLIEQLCFKDLFHTLGERLLEESGPLLGYGLRLQG